MNTHFPGSKRPFVIAILLSLAFLVLCAWFYGAIKSTGSDTVDSQGRTMGFNDTFSAEHYWIATQKGSVAATLHEFSIWTKILVGAHLALLALLHVGRTVWLKIFCCLQCVFFFWGWLGLLAVPLDILDIFVIHSGDRESFVDVPWVEIMSQGPWVALCLCLLWRLWIKKNPRQISSRSLSV